MGCRPLTLEWRLIRSRLAVGLFVIPASLELNIFCKTSVMQGRALQLRRVEDEIEKPRDRRTHGFQYAKRELQIGKLLTRLHHLATSPARAHGFHRCPAEQSSRWFALNFQSAAMLGIIPRVAKRGTHGPKHSPILRAEGYGQKLIPSYWGFN